MPRAAKVVAGASAGVAFGAIGEAINRAAGHAVLQGRGITIVLSSGDILRGHRATASSWALASGEVALDGGSGKLDDLVRAGLGEWREMKDVAENGDADELRCDE